MAPVIQEMAAQKPVETAKILLPQINAEAKAEATAEHNQKQKQKQKQKQSHKQKHKQNQFAMVSHEVS